MLHYSNEFNNFIEFKSLKMIYKYVILPLTYDISCFFQSAYDSER